MDFDSVKTWLADSFRLRPLLLGLAIGLAVVPLLKTIGWIF